MTRKIEAMHAAYGVWNHVTKRFVFGIRAVSRRAAENELFRLAGKGGYCWRYEVKPIPHGFVNPTNDRYRRGSDD